MKKLDLHIHTISTGTDHNFEFSIEKLIEYVDTLNIDGIAITNHNLFDQEQFLMIQEKLSGKCVVMPGIEISVGEEDYGHMLCIADDDDLYSFSTRCQSISESIHNGKVSLRDIDRVFPEEGRFLWIPHYDKKPRVEPDVIKAMGKRVLCGETSSVKKFLYRIKDKESLVPVLFSDLRPTEYLQEFPSRQTYFDINSIKVSSINRALLDKSRVSLTENEGHRLFYALPDLPLSTGLNVIIGGRSSGKTYTLDQIVANNDNNASIKYIKQFELIEPNPEKAAKEFTDHIAAKRSSFADDYFKPFQQAVDIAKEVSLEDDLHSIDCYVSSLVRYAKESNRRDQFAKSALFNETKFPKRTFEGIRSLITAVEELLDSREYRATIEKHVSRDALLSLHEELIHKHNSEMRRSLEENWVNGVVDKIKRNLNARSAADEIPWVDFYECQMDRVKVRKFKQLASLVKREAVINRQEIEGFVVQTKKRPFNGASELKNFSGKRDVSFSKLMDSYETDPYDYLLGLKKMDGLAETDYYEYFAYVDYQILNQYGYSVSGGERAEFRLLQEINDAYLYDMLLIDEPESSFDNIFLKSRVNHIIRELSRIMPVVIVTHNNTVGASIKPDYLVFTKRDIGESVEYKRFYGLPSEKELKSFDGETISNYAALLDCLEAGESSYNERKEDYALLKD